MMLLFSIELSYQYYWLAELLVVIVSFHVKSLNMFVGGENKHFLVDHRSKIDGFPFMHFCALLCTFYG